MVSSIKFAALFCFAVSLLAITSYFSSARYTAPKTVLKALDNDEVILNFLTIVTSESEETLSNAITSLDKNWEEGYEIMLIETLYFTQSRKVSNKLLRLLERKTRKKFNYDFDQWYQWVWSKTPKYKTEYFEFKSRLHQLIDKKFGPYFLGREGQSNIRLDEVRWGGVLQDGIPPLRNPEMISAEEATYLSDDNVVFGIAVNGDVRAYPKRILAWHEMFVDTVGETPVAGVYCTLCGTVILYKTEHNGVNHELGTSGFLYRSNKLMYDKATQSLWSTLEGEPAIGPLVGKGIKLDYLSVVTTTWGEWKRRHPETKVLSLNTGHRRNYGEGVAYQEYFATDELMFVVPDIGDKSIKNKDEILAIRNPGYTDENLAIASKYLKKNPLYTDTIGDLNFVVFTDKTGAHRVYTSNAVKFKSYDGKSTAVATNGIKWTITEEGMVSETGEELSRFPSHNAFWFGYKAAFPEVTLIK